MYISQNRIFNTSIRFEPVSIRNEKKENMIDLYPFLFIKDTKGMNTDKIARSWTVKYVAPTICYTEPMKV